jgi:acyl-coenzyme A synthetase/AMP-(fatty) acid ligase
VGSVYVLDARGQLVPFGVTGEICIGSTSLASGYWQHEAESQRRFIPDPFGTGDGRRLFRTRDFGRRLSDGSIELIVSPTSSTWIQGKRVVPAEVEAALLEDPSIKECAVLVRDEASSSPQLVAYVILLGAPLTSLRHWCVRILQRDFRQHACQPRWCRSAFSLYSATALLMRLRSCRLR